MANLVADALADGLAMLASVRGSLRGEAPWFIGAAGAAQAEPVEAPRDVASGAIAAGRMLLESGELTSAELVDQSLAAIAARNDELHAFVEIDEVEARAQAAKLDGERAAGRVRGPLHGVPVSVKDLYAVAGGTTRAGSLAFERRDGHDAAAVARLRDRGAVILGKTATHEFAMGVLGLQSRNPHDASRIAGGSSSGAAIAVSAGMGMGALGTDTRGSARIPAALCGVVGLKPTFGRVSLDGVFELAATMDHFGSLAGSVTDAALLLDELAPGCNALSGAARSAAGMRIGVARGAWAGVERDVEQPVDEALAVLDAAGAELVELDRPDTADFEAANLIGLVISRCEAASFHRGLRLDTALYSAESRAQLETAAGVEAVDYLDAQRFRRRLADDMARVFDGVDAVVTPTVPMVAPRRDAVAHVSLALTRAVALWSFVGFPAMSVPVAPAASGLPVGLQVAAAPHAEATMVAVGRAIERGVNAR